MEDLYTLDDHNSARHLADNFERIWAEEKLLAVNSVTGVPSTAGSSETETTSHAQPVSVYRVLYRQFGVRYLLAGLLHFVQAAASISSPVIIGLLTQFVSDSKDEGTRQPLWLGMVYAIVFFM